MGDEWVETMSGRARLAPGVPPTPAGYVRCWWCCRGRLLEVGERPPTADKAATAAFEEHVAKVVAGHRWRFAPRQANPERFHRERSHDVEDDVRAEHAVAGGLGPSEGAIIQRMEF